MEGRSPDALARWLLSFAGEAVPISPPELVADVRRLARETREHLETNLYAPPRDCRRPAGEKP